jgi:hypothetical protein
MKTIKIVLIIITLAAIGYFVYSSIIATPPLPPPPPPLPQECVGQIDAEIESLKKSPMTKFGTEFHTLYVNIQYHISEYGKRGCLDGKQDLLAENLYSVYSEKFIEQSFYIFSDTKWEKPHLDFIIKETTELQKSSILKKGSDVYKKFDEIQTIIKKYNEINSFIVSTDSYSKQNVPYTSIGNTFPIDEVKEKVAKANRYESNKLDNEYVNNCKSLHTGLLKIPQKMYRKHLDYLKNRVSYWSNRYDAYVSYSDYRSDRGAIINREIDSIESDISIYGLSSPDKEWDNIKEDWKENEYNAFTYLQNKTNQK